MYQRNRILRSNHKSYNYRGYRKKNRVFLCTWARSNFLDRLQKLATIKKLESRILSKCFKKKIYAYQKTIKKISKQAINWGKIVITNI